ncbi:MAG: phytanoyl-CoA dioxygenase family protein [Planctomycetota bacterium]|nr:phytanoyl-CoA dioxygenase family protein [Planctomycetota bacterium]
MTVLAPEQPALQARVNVLQPVGAAALAEGPGADPRDARAHLRPKVLAYGLTPEQLASYRAKGYVHLRGAFGAAEVAAWREACDEVRRRADLIHPDNLRFELCKEQPDGSRPVWKIDPFADLHTTFGALVRDRRILDPLASIYDGRDARLFKDKLIYKPPGEHGNGLHQDYHWWQGFPTSLISVLVAIDPADEENGCTEVFPGYEKGFMTEPGRWSELTEDRIRLDEGEKLVTEPGDIALFHCFAPHRAAPNRSTRWRRQAFLTYNDAADGEHYFAHREHYWWYVTRCRKAEDQRRAFFV